MGFFWSVFLKFALEKCHFLKMACRYAYKNRARIPPQVVSSWAMCPDELIIAPLIKLESIKKCILIKLGVVNISMELIDYQKKLIYLSFHSSYHPCTTDVTWILFSTRFWKTECSILSKDSLTTIRIYTKCFTIYNIIWLLLGCNDSEQFVIAMYTGIESCNRFIFLCSLCLFQMALKWYFLSRSSA